jgi:predicted RNA-binding protein with PUA-like domain
MIGGPTPREALKTAMETEYCANETMPQRPVPSPAVPDPNKGPTRVGCWLVKQEPEDYSWDAFAKDGKTRWEGVRNYQARNNLQGMKTGDAVLFYESGDSKSVVGIASVSRAAYPDPTAEEPGWVAVELKAGRRLARTVTLAQVKAEPSLAQILLVRNSRLSVMPLDREAFDAIVRMGS